MNRESKRDLKLVRTKLLEGLKRCEGVPSTVALTALVELTVDTAISLCGREHAVDVICRTVNLLMTTKHNKGE